MTQFPVLLEGAKARVHLVKIRDGVTVVRSARHIICEQGTRPDGSKSHPCYVVQMVNHPPDIPSMAGIVIGSINALFLHARNDVIVGVAVGKPIRRD